MTARFSLTQDLRLPESDLAAAEAALLLTGARGVRPLAAATPVADPARLAPSEVFIPEAYEPNYAYPLIVWLQHEQQSPLEFPQRMRQISTRNYCGAQLKCVPPAAGDVDGFAELQTRLADLVTRMRRDYHIHSERIFVAGFDNYGGAALQLCLARPEWLAGAIVLGGTLPPTPRVLHKFRDLRGKRVFLATGPQEDGWVSVEDLRRDNRLLHIAGLRMCARLFEGAGDVKRSMLLEVDRWVMQEIHRAASSTAQMV